MQPWLCPIIWTFLKGIDQQFAMEVKRQGCRHCGSKLDWANFWRKPRGLNFVDGDIRFSLCCRNCRRRVTPESARFLWRKVYVLLVVALSETRPFGVGRRTLGRWRIFWAETLSVTSSFSSRIRHRLAVEFDFTLGSFLRNFMTAAGEDFISLARCLSRLGCAAAVAGGQVRAEDAT